MSNSSLLIKCLVGTCSLIVLLIGAWGADVTTRVTELEHRQTITESHYASIDVRLTDLAEDLREIKDRLFSSTHPKEDH